MYRDDSDFLDQMKKETMQTYNQQEPVKYGNNLKPVETTPKKTFESVQEEYAEKAKLLKGQELLEHLKSWANHLEAIKKVDWNK
jgi:hypothetical protein